MNYAKDFTIDQQQLIRKLDIQIENRDYSVEEIKHDLSTIANYVMSKSSKNGDLLNEMNRYNHVMNILVKNEK
ncbi:MAG: hypothetical protein J6I85_06980 [Clostridia bacterium]|nr:hypothetical protein [Clostridia bacterium]MBP3801743.1 hypothetical protein [Clostridia bacterium]